LKEIKVNSEIVRECSRLARKLYIKGSKNSYLVSKNLKKIAKITCKSRTRGNMISIIGNTNLMIVKHTSKAVRINP